MKEIFLVYKTDTWHSYSSREIIAVATSPDRAVGFCRQHAKREGNQLTEEDLNLLSEIQQSQGYAGEGEFQIEPFDTDKLL